MKKILTIGFIVITSALVSYAQPLSEIRIVHEDERSLVLEFSPHMTMEQVQGTDGTIFTHFRFFNSQVIYDSNGQPDYLRAVQILLPSPKYTLQVLTSEFQIQDSMKLLPKPVYQRLKDFGLSVSYHENKDAFTAKGVNQHPLAELVRIGQSSLNCRGTLVWHPLQVLEKGKIKVFTKIIVRLAFGDSFQPGISSTSLLRGEFQPKEQPIASAKIVSRQSSANDSPLASGDWYRMEIQDAGMYKLDYEYLQKLGIQLTDINSIRIFGNGGLAIPDDNTTPRPNTLEELPRLVIRSRNDGLPAQEDYIVFYGKGVRGWRYNGNNSFQHYIHPYTEKNYYFFTFNQGNGKGMDSLSASPYAPSAFQPATFQEKLSIEQERYNLMGSGRQWAGKLFLGSDNSDSYYQSLPGLLPSSSIKYTFTFLHRSASLDTLNIYENGQVLAGPLWMGPTNPSDDVGVPYAQTITATAVWNAALPGNASVIKIRVGSGNQDAKTWLDWMELTYQRKFEAVSDALIFTTSDMVGPVQFRVSKFSSANILAFDITDHASVKHLTQLESGQNDSCRFQLQQVAGSVQDIAVVGTQGFKVPPQAVKISNSNIRGTQVPIDFIIISPEEFLPEAQRLKAHRESHDSLRTLIVDINQVYNEFSGGLPDPLAIREFLRYALGNWSSPKPRYVLLFGGGHFDYKNVSTSQRNWIPPFETDESLVPISSYPTDDQFAVLGSPYTMYPFAIGRIPARSVAEAAVTVDKIIAYETTSPADSWRNRILFVADDGKTSQGDDGSVYTNQTDQLAESESYTPKSFEKNKIYIVAYPTVNSAAGRRKPEANRAIVDAINQGAVITNFIGHGNERVWTHESVFTREDDLPQLINRDRLTFLMAATCSYGQYDNPQEVSSAEQFVTMEQGGAIADVAAARLVYGPQNFSLNTSLITNLLVKDATGRTPRLGDAWQATKGSNMDENSIKFHLLGDPALRLVVPQNKATMDSINGQSTVDTIRMKSLSYVHLAGTLKQNDGTLLNSFTGKGTLQLFDSQKDIAIQDGVSLFKFSVSGSLLYRGEISITNGHYTATVPIPKDVTFGKSARISLYASSDQTDGVGYTEKVIIDGVDTTAVTDTVGPQIAIYLDALTFQSGGVVQSNPTLIVRLEDESGVNTSTVGVGHQLSATISPSLKSIDLSNYYRSDLDTYRSGEVRYQIRDLLDGTYSVRVKAWDIHNNSSEAETSFEVHAADDFALLHVVNYPNPFSRSTVFTFQRTASDPIDVEVRIYSIAGRLLQSLQSHAVAGTFVHIPWDGKDREGSNLANGIYFYKLVVRSQDGTKTNEQIGKCAVMR